MKHGTLIAIGAIAAIGLGIWWAKKKGVLGRGELCPQCQTYRSL